MCQTSLEEEYGRFVKPEELAAFLGVDTRTVKKYSDLWGGIEVSPGKLRFFDKVIRRKLDAQFNKQKRQEALACGCDGQRPAKRKTIQGQLKGRIPGSSPMGKGGKGKDRKGADRHGRTLILVTVRSESGPVKEKG